MGKGAAEEKKREAKEKKRENKQGYFCIYDTTRVLKN